MARLTEQQWVEILQKKQEGKSYSKLATEYGVSTRAIIDKVKANRAADIVAVATSVIQDEQSTLPVMTENNNHDIMNASNIDHHSRTELNLQISIKAKLVNKLLTLQEKSITNCESLLEFMWQVISVQKISVADFEKYAKLHDNLVNQIERLSKLHGMGFSPSTQINQQFNMGNGKTNGKKYDDDEFTGNEEIEIIFCTSKEQAEILKAQEND